jgi:hypothetical protein
MSTNGSGHLEVSDGWQEEPEEAGLVGRGDAGFCIEALKEALANQTGANLATEGWAPDRLVLRAGDLLSLGSEDSTRLYQVTGDLTSSATGAATLTLAPHLRRAPPQFAPLNVSAPQVVLRLTEPVPTRIGRADNYRFSVTAREAL